MRPVLGATLIGATAIVLWSTLALVTTMTGDVPPFQLVALAFSVSAAVGLVRAVATGITWTRIRRWPPAMWLIGVGGLFGYHACYFLALRRAPPVEASLINYLWPLLIVVLSALLPGERLTWRHLTGAVSGLAGTVILIGGPARLEAEREFALGYAAAFAAAVLWAAYSVLNRRFSDVPTSAVAGCCLITALLAAVCHLIFETTVWPAGAGQWMAVAALGLGPVGLAFYVWDYGVKHGDIRALGTAAYATPLLSTALLVAAGRAEMHWSIIVACVLIVGGAAVAAGDLLAERRRRGPAADGSDYRLG
jgi:drug/metabolite transporter (DMT)-like permease